MPKRKNKNFPDFGKPDYSIVSIRSDSRSPHALGNNMSRNETFLTGIKICPRIQQIEDIKDEIKNT